MISDHQCRRCCEWSRLGSLPHGHNVAACPQNRPEPRSFFTHGGVFAETPVGSGSENMDLDSQTPSGRCHDSACVCFGTEPQGTTKGEARCQGLGNEPTSAVLSSQLCCYVQERTRVREGSGVVAEDASDGWVAEEGLPSRELLRASRRRLLRWRDTRRQRSQRNGSGAISRRYRCEPRRGAEPVPSPGQAQTGTPLQGRPSRGAGGSPARRRRRRCSGRSTETMIPILSRLPISKFLNNRTAASKGNSVLATVGD